MFEGKSENFNASLEGVLDELPKSPVAEEGMESEIDCMIVVSTDNQRISLEDSTLQLLSEKNYGLSLDIYLSHGDGDG